MEIRQKNRITKAIVVLFANMLILFGISSCEELEGLLDKEPLDKISDPVVWSDVYLIDAYVIQTYANMRDGWQDYVCLSVISDDSYARERGGAHLVQRGELTPSNMGFTGWAWEHYYGLIARTNIFLDKMTEENIAAFSADDQSLLKRMAAEMKFLRAYSYFRLSAFFGGVPLITKALDMGDDLMLKRESYDKIVEFVVTELDESANILPLSYPSEERGRATKGAALSIKSRALLYAASPLHNPDNDKSKWQAAADAAKAVIDLGLYSLNPDYAETFTEKGNFNNEIIFEKVFNNDVSVEARIELWFYPNASNGWAVCVPTQSQVEAYETKNGLSIQDDPSYDFTRFWENRDPRFYATILYDGAPWKDGEIETFLPGGKDSNQGPTGFNASYTGYYTSKFVDKELTGNPKTIWNTSSPNWPYCRYAEILLNYAEAEFNLGQEDIAREYINMVRARPSVNMPPVTDSGQDLMERIMNERRVELYLEEHRFFDIRRWKIKVPEDNFIMRINIERDVSTGEKEYSLSPLIEFALPERMYLLPIPQDEIDKNPQLEQNPGY